MSRSLRPAVLLALCFAAGAGCIYITPTTFQDKLHTLDQDTDGSKNGTDCDDNDGTRSPDFAEIPDNCIDDDCDGLNGGIGVDDMDTDEDSFPIETFADWLAHCGLEEGDAKAVMYPTTLADDTQADCDDSNINIHPGATETFYDGIDENCDGKNDFDQDEDGYVPDGFGAESGLPEGDCNDTKEDGAGVNPGVSASDDLWYDGIDQDCAGNNDYDADGDGYMPDSVVDPISGEPVTDVLGAFAEYCRSTGIVESASQVNDCWGIIYGVDSQAPELGDCADIDGADPDELPPAAATVGIVAADVHPGAVDPLYDGVDQDCNSSNDFDGDVDEYIDDATYQSDYNAFVAFYGYSCDVDTDGDGNPEYSYDDVAGNDCDDLDALVHPGVMEHLGDATDQDCDGGTDTTPWLSNGFSWTAPRPPVVGRLPGATLPNTSYLLTTVGGAFSQITYTEAGITLPFDPALAFDHAPGSPILWHNNTTSPFPTADAVDMITQGDQFYPATQYWNSNATTLTGYFVSKQAVPNGSSFRFNIAYETFKPFDLYNDMDVVRNADPSVDDIWALGCGDETFTFTASHDTASSFTKFGGTFGADTAANLGVDVDYTGGITCFIDPTIVGQIALGTICDGTTCTTYELDSSTAQGDIRVAATQPYSGKHWTSVNQSGTWRVANKADDSTGLGLELFDGTNTYDLFPTYDVRYGEAYTFGATTYVIAVIDDQDSDGIDDVVIAYGDPAGTLTEIVMPWVVDGVTYSPHGASIYADADRVFYAVSSTTSGTPLADMVAWGFELPVP